MKRHLLTAADLDRDDATLVLDTAAEMARLTEGRSVKKLPTLRGRTVINLFFEDSTRTRTSFELAAKVELPADEKLALLAETSERLRMELVQELLSNALLTAQRVRRAAERASTNGKVDLG